MCVSFVPLFYGTVSTNNEYNDHLIDMIIYTSGLSEGRISRDVEMEK
jgi:hypothetical protein